MHSPSRSRWDMLLDAFSLVTESSHQTYRPPSPSFYGKNGSVGMVASTLLSVTFRCFTLPSGTIVPSYRLGTATKLRCWGNRYRKLGVGLIVTRGRSCDRHNQSVIPLVRFRRGCCRDHGQTPSRPEPLANTDQSVDPLFGTELSHSHYHSLRVCVNGSNKDPDPFPTHPQ